MEYNCNECSYKTNIKYVYKKHLTSKKHLEKIDAKNIKNKYCCPYCTNEYSTASNLSKHKKTCNEKEQIQAEHDKQINELVNKHKQQIKDLTIKHKDEMLKLSLKL